MTSSTQTYGELIRVRTGSRSNAEVMRRVPLGAGVTNGGISEDELESLLFRYPESLPIAAIDPAYAGTVPICRQLTLPAGFADALYVNSLGRLTLVEFKLWRNPEARREVIGQILDYAKDLASWTYEDLQRQVSIALRTKGNAIYHLVNQRYPDTIESEFVDNVTRHLRRGEFLLLIIGDGIQEGAANIVDFVQRYSGLHFNLAMVEAALYRDAANSLIVQPRVLAKTEIVQRFVVEGGFTQEITGVDVDEQQETLSDQDEQNLRFWTAVLQDFSFSDPTIDVPAPVKDSTLYVQVRNAGFNGWALCFDGYLQRNAPGMGCFLMARRNHSREVRIFEEIAASLGSLSELEGLELWNNAGGLRRIGFRREGTLRFLAQDEDSEEFREAVTWMQQHLDRLVSTLHPSLQTMLAEE